MYALEIINALNDPDNPAKPKGLNAKLKNVQVPPTRLCVNCLGPITNRHGETVAKLEPEVVRCYVCWSAQASGPSTAFDRPT